MRSCLRALLNSLPPNPWEKRVPGWALIRGYAHPPVQRLAPVLLLLPPWAAALLLAPAALGGSCQAGAGELDIWVAADN